MGKTYTKLRHNRCVQVFIFILISGLNIADMISDWLLFHDVDAAEEGLVFGPPDRKIWTALLIFSVIGAILFTFEIINLGKDIFTMKAWVDMDIMSAIIIWLEDIPQITINCVIVACREEAISVFQISKASVVIFGACIRMVVGIYRACRRDHSSNIAKLKQCNTFKFIMFFGLTLMVCGSVIVFMFAQSSLHKDGTFVFKTPRTLWKGEYNDEKYFSRVGIYGNLGFLDNSDSDSAAANHPAHNHWMKFCNIHDIRHKSDETVVRILFDGETKKNFRIQAQFKDIPENNTDVCYRVNQESWSLSKDPNCTVFLNDSAARTIDKISFKFKYVKPRNHLILGDIQYNVKVTVNGSCVSGLQPNIQPTQEKADKIISSEYEIVLRYFQALEKYEHAGHVVERQGHNLTFYDPNRNLVDITEVWQTGFLGCKSSGSVSPHLNSQLPVTCLN